VYNSTPARPHCGFSLIELLVVLVILSLLGGIVAPRVLKHLSQAKSDTAALQIEDLSAALDVYMLEVGSYPTSDQGLRALIEAPADSENWNGPYLRKSKVPPDPWGNEYQYKSPGDHGEYDLFSYGADNAPGGEKHDRDVVNWE
jgi:general secretion pathway protein G